MYQNTIQAIPRKYSSIWDVNFYGIQVVIKMLNKIKKKYFMNIYSMI